ncbi:MAG TPA: hypothetical protein VFX17_03395 [Patescibacteria group bacterium]|nr:hypothetical protein [Patescibacteria group bacterium]
MNILDEIKNKNSNHWESMREANALQLFTNASKRVPAYKDFLKKNNINPGKIKTFQDFQNIPPVSKKNYLRQYELKDLLWDGNFKKPLVFTSTTGSTGEPFYFPRSHALDKQYSFLAELFLEHGYRDKQKGPTLIIVVFGMGVWIGGLLTYQAFEIAGRRGDYPISLITPGINKDQIFAILKKLAPQFKQTIIAGYPPFVKDIVDSALDIGIDLKKLNLRLLFAAESFSEKFRDHLTLSAGIRNAELDTLNIYGTADIGAMAWETPTAIFTRRQATENQDVFRKIFGTIRKTPTLAQYNPNFITFEAPNGDILLSGDNSIPLVRYEIGDRGRTMSFNDVKEVFQSEGLDYLDLFNKAKLSGYIYQLPFVYVYERSDFSVVLSGANIYPEEIKEALISKKLKQVFTGKFTMEIGYTHRFHETLTINLELKPNQKSSKQLSRLALSVITETLLEKNSEFHAIHTGKVKGSTPIIKLWPYESPNYFKPGIKQKWVKK